MDKTNTRIKRVNRQVIKIYMLKNDYSVRSFAKVLNTNRESLRRKLKCEYEFNENEIAILYELGILQFGENIES